MSAITRMVVTGSPFRSWSDVIPSEPRWLRYSQGEHGPGSSVQFKLESSDDQGMLVHDNGNSSQIVQSPGLRGRRGRSRMAITIGATVAAASDRVSGVPGLLASCDARTARFGQSLAPRPVAQASQVGVVDSSDMVASIPLWLTRCARRADHCCPQPSGGCGSSLRASAQTKRSRPPSAELAPDSRGTTSVSGLGIGAEPRPAALA